MTVEIYGSPVAPTQTTVAGLPAAGSTQLGLIYLVTDALTPVTLSAVVAGGAVKILVFNNGAAWIVL